MSQEYTNDAIEGLDIAIIGMAGRFPGARNVHQLWKNICEKKESITFFTEEELIRHGVEPYLVKDPNYVPARGILEDVDKFDAGFFDYPPREAELLDPQHRLFMESAWEALENAGYDPDRYEGLIGVFGGVGMNMYLLRLLQAQQGVISAAEAYQLTIGNEKDFLTTRISYKFNLQGASVDVQTACSTSLSAVHLACLNLLSYQCDIALAGGATIFLPQESGYYYQEGMILSPDGHCRPFDARAAGTVPGNGVGVVVLKRLVDALADGDYIYAVIKGSAMNNDGANRVGYTAPSVDGQADVIATAQAVAGMHPENIQYIEAHGTGTNLGDPIEIAALTQAFREQTDKKQYCAIGSVKANVGHLDAAAGVTGLIKTALALHYKKIPPSINFEQPNPQIDFANSPFFVNTELRDWPREKGPRQAGVSSFGIGGTNVHVVLEEAPERDSTRPARRSYHLVLLSARSENALAQYNQQLSTHFKQNPELNIADASFTLAVGRKALNHRQAVVASSLAEAAEILSARDPKKIMVAAHPKIPASPPVVFMFSGQGAQYVNMGRQLYHTEPVFREAVDECSEMLQPLLGEDLRTLLYPEPGDEEAASEKLKQTYITQPALFVIEYALARLWMALGVSPEAMIGHSIGEYTAACLSGVMSLESALRIVTHRGQLMQRMPAGAMLSVHLPEAELRPMLPEDISLAAVNGANLCAVSGTFEAIEAFETDLSRKGVEYRRLKTSHAFHSAMMDPILEEFTQIVAAEPLNPPQIPYISNVTGTWITEQDATNPEYYARHLRYTVRFANGVQELLKDENRVFLEVGPGNTLVSLVRSLPESRGRVVVNSVRHPKEDTPDEARFAETLGRLWLSGVPVKWDAYFEGENRLRVPLPTYPFERQRYWLEADTEIRTSAPAQKKGKQPDPAQWFYVPSYHRKPFSVWQEEAFKKEAGTWLVFQDAGGLSTAITTLLEAAGHSVVSVVMGDSFQEADGTFTVQPGNEEHFAQLFKALIQRETFPDRILFAWSVLPWEATGTWRDSARQSIIQQGYFSVLALAKALAAHAVGREVEVAVLASFALDAPESETVIPYQRMLDALLRVIPQEIPGVRCRLLDVVMPQSNGNTLNHLARNILGELVFNPATAPIALREGFYWEQVFEPYPLQSADSAPLVLREHGVYLITGGLGNIGRTIARYLVETVKAQVVLLGRRPFPEREAWENWLKDHPADDPVVQTIHQLLELEAQGGKVFTFTANVADRQQMQRVISTIQEKIGALNGVFHAAGVVGNQAFVPLTELNPDVCQQQFEAKVDGVQVLEEVLREVDPDFVVLQSSLSAVLGGLGFGAYAAANAFMDGFVYAANRDNHQLRWRSINWEGWHFPETVETSASGLGRDMMELALSPEEGREALHRILWHHTIPQVVVSTGDLQKRFDEWVARQESEREASAAPAGGKYSRPNLTTPFVAPRNDLEKEIAAVWEELLGIEGIGVYDDFFDLGGNSLSGTQLLSRLREKFKAELPLKDLFENPTIAGVAEMLEKEKQGASQADKLASLLEKVEKLSDEEAKKLLEKKEGKDE